MFNLFKKIFGFSNNNREHYPAPPIHFHGGCYGCTQQQKHGTDFCFDCCYFQPDWSKPNLNNSQTVEDMERCRIIAKRQSISPIQPISVPEETTLQIADKIRNETDEEKLNILRVQFLLRYLSTCHTAPDKETLITDVLYRLGFYIDPDGYAMSKGFDKFKRLLRDNHLNL
jgi:hypothetical protein